ncbi:1-deoxy-D-xylulose-5-phosphate reductoisomerase [Natronospirillum operosum]|uniref:1-deoxy-D-xylulose 5-phosphate reductoisomerase n=1 Tax=Natronospirillum operosum TaxID=2759953 RepID=A0A4Z0WIZ0_9GAMM|nr:1-deoxy-D-xylulose-5-phosphate reductoisomerase [Natronospirillum operosum]TGG95125.1 1-deoxy-D-xylulose-5-phosphate reductoisomerase [Natronospirillum operosum]
MATLRRVTVLGATGSVGCSTLDVISRHPERYQVLALSGHSNLTRLAQQCATHRPVYAVVPDQQAAIQLTAALSLLSPHTEVLAGPEALQRVAALPECDIVMAAIVGAAGLAPTLAAAQAGKTLLLANKESLVVGGALLMQAVRAGGATLLPIDSEHNAIFQCLPAATDDRAGVTSVLLTASGGPCRTLSAAELQAVTPEQACAHPNWSMGRKISVDSATLMNKGLELIEACWLFDLRPSDIEVVVHPQSVIHSMVRYADGSVLAQLGEPDMRTPIAYGLAWPERIDAGVQPLDFSTLQALTFEAPDMDRFPCLRLAAEAFEAGETAPAILNAANEEAVAAFLEHRIGFMDIPRINAAVLDQVAAVAVRDLPSLLAMDEQARQSARTLINAVE